MAPPVTSSSTVPKQIPVVIVQLPRKGRKPNPEFDRIWTKEEDTILLKALKDGGSSIFWDNIISTGNHAPIDNRIDWYQLAKTLKRHVPDCINRATLLRIVNENQLVEQQKKLMQKERIAGDMENNNLQMKEYDGRRKLQEISRDDSQREEENDSQEGFSNSAFDKKGDTNVSTNHKHLTLSGSMQGPLEVRFVSHALTSSSVEINVMDTENSENPITGNWMDLNNNDSDNEKKGNQDISSQQSQYGHLLLHNTSHSSSIHSMNSSVYRSLLLPDPESLEQEGLSLSALNNALDEVDAPSFYMGYNSNINAVGLYGENMEGENDDTLRGRLERSSSNGTDTSGEKEG